MTPMPPTTATVLARALTTNGARVVFGIPGVHTLSLYDALADERAVRLVVNRHESGSAYGAMAYAKVTGRPAVVSMVPGPGALNGASGVLSALSDRVPMVVLTVELDESDRRAEVHECDLEACFGPIVKRQLRVASSADVELVVAEAFAEAMAAPAGPVQILIRRGVLTSPAAAQRAIAQRPGPVVDPASVRTVLGFLAACDRPALLIGGPLAARSAVVLELATRLGAPVFTDAAARGVIAEDDPRSAGLLTWSASQAVLDRSDGLLVLGSRLSEISTLNWDVRLPARTARVDADARELHGNHPATTAVLADPALLADALVGRVERRDTAWYVAAGQPVLAGLAPARPGHMHPKEAVATVRAALPRDVFVTTDATATEFWLSEPTFPVHRPNGFVIPEVQQTMGFGVPAAIDVAAACAEVGASTPVVCVSGDGSLQMTLGELGPAMHLGQPIVLVVFDDGHYNALRIYQDGVYGRRVGVELQNPDLCALAASYGASAVRVSDASALDAALRAGLRNASGLSVVVVAIDESFLPDRYARRIDQLAAPVTPESQAQTSSTPAPVRAEVSIVRTPGWTSRRFA
jgi:thiamine pyrophosphate-dependent acetolactate synthase large subunit-like protein